MSEPTVVVSVRLPKDIAEKMKQLADDRMVHRNLLFRKAIEDFLKELPSIEVSLSPDGSEK